MICTGDFFNRLLAFQDDCWAKLKLVVVEGDSCRVLESYT